MGFENQTVSQVPIAAQSESGGREGRIGQRFTMQQRLTEHLLFHPSFAVLPVYFYPSKGCALKPEQQVQQALQAIQGHKFGTFWLDVESGGSQWTKVSAQAEFGSFPMRELSTAMLSGRSLIIELCILCSLLIPTLSIAR